MRTVGNTRDLVKIDPAMVPQDIVAAKSEDGVYYDMTVRHKGCFCAVIGEMVETEEIELSVIESTTCDDRDATSQAIAASVLTVTANTDASEIEIDTAASAATDSVTINGIEFTMAGATNVAQREWLNAAGLAECINSVEYGCSGLYAVDNAAVVTVYACPHGDELITATHTDLVGATAITTNRAIALVDVSEWDLTDGYAYVGFAAEVTVLVGAGIPVAAVLLREGYRQTQHSAGA